MYSSIAAGVQARSLLPPEQEGVRYLYPASGGGGGGGTPGVTASPTSLIFFGTAGAADPAAQTVTLSGAAGVSWTAAPLADSGTWLAVSPQSGAAPSVLTVSVRTAGLPAGFYGGRVAVVAQGITREIGVALSLSQPPAATLEATPATLSFAAALTGSSPVPKAISLSGTPGAAWSAIGTTSGGGPWLRISPSSGTLPGQFSVAVDPGGLTAQSYAGTITINSATVTRHVTVLLEVTTQPLLEVEPAQINLSSAAGVTVPVCASFRVAAGNASLDWKAVAGAGWLAVLPDSGRAPANATLCATAANLPAGNYTTSVAVSGAALNSPQSIIVRFSVSGTVAIQEGGVVNAASFAPGRPVAAGELVSIFGTNLAPQTASAQSFPLPTDLGNTRVLVAGVPARLIYVSPAQINLVTPSILEGMAGSSTVVTVFNGSRSSVPARVNVDRVSPGVFGLLGNGAGAGAVTHNDGRLVSRPAPALAGEAISVYLTGLGPLAPAVPDGEPAPADPLARAAAHVRLLVDGQPATVLYAGAAPGFSGLQVVVATMPGSLARRFPEMVVEVDGVSSNRFTAGGPALLDVSPAAVRTGADAAVVVRGINLPPSAALQIAGAEVRAVLEEGPLQTLRATIPAGTLGPSGVREIRVIDTEARGEPSSNPVLITVTP
jgi:adhesin/invasin